MKENGSEYMLHLKNDFWFDGIMKVNIIAYLGNRASDVGVEMITLFG
jgi:hypothetical protein